MNGTSTLGTCGHVLDRASVMVGATRCTDCETNAILAAQSAGRRGMARATAARPEDRQKVDVAIRRLAATGKPFSANHARELHGITGPVVGAAFQAAAKAGLIKRIGYEPSTDEGTHGHPVAVWQGKAA